MLTLSISFQWRFIAGKSVINGGFIAGKIIEPNCGFGTVYHQNLDIFYPLLHILGVAKILVERTNPWTL